MVEQVQQVTTKNPKEVEQGKRLAESNHSKKEELKAQREREAKLTYYGTGAVVAIGVLGDSCYQPKESPVHQPKETLNKFNID